MHTGFKLTNVTWIARRSKIAKSVLTEIKLLVEVKLVTGHNKVDLDHLEGRSAKLLLLRVIWANVMDMIRSSVEWVI